MSKTRVCPKDHRHQHRCNESVRNDIKHSRNARMSRSKESNGSERHSSLEGNSSRSNSCFGPVCEEPTSEYFSIFPARSQGRIKIRNSSRSSWNFVVSCVCSVIGLLGPRLALAQQTGYTTVPVLCENGQRWCSRCENTTSLWLSPGPSDPQAGIADPSWITFPQLWDRPGPGLTRPAGLPESFIKGNIVTQIGTQTFPTNIYHYFELLVQGGNNLQAADARRDLVYLSLVSPASMQISMGQVVPTTATQAQKPAYDFYVGQNCIPTEGNWNNQGYGNIDAYENMKSIVVNVTQDARYFIALQSRALRYGVSAYDFTMKLSRGTLEAAFPQTRCYPLIYRFPNEINNMIEMYSQTQAISSVVGGSVPSCGQTPFELEYNVNYISPPPKGGLTQQQIAEIVGAAGGSVVLVSLISGLCLWRRYKRTTARMAKFSSLSRGLPDALLDGEGQEVAV